MPTAEGSPSLHRLAMRPGDPRTVADLGRAARRVEDAAAQRGVGLAGRAGDPGPSDVPAGLWPGDEGDAVAVNPLIAANPALAAYAAQLRQKRADTPTTPRRGLPLLARRDRSAAGPDTVPGALARRSVPVDRVEDPDVAGIVRRATAARPIVPPVRGGTR